jgi:hypothetical protein
MNQFSFDLGATVTIVNGSENGEVIGRAEYNTAENNYLVRYVAGDGRAVEAWWGESALS